MRFKKFAVILSGAIVFALATLAAFPIAANAGGGTGKAPAVLTTFFPLYVHALNVAGSFASVEVVLPSGVGIHDFRPKPSDMIKFTKATLVVKNGAGLDEFVVKMAEGSGNSKLKMIDASAGANPIMGGSCSHSEKDGGGHAHGSECSHGAGDIDPHTWLSIRNAVIQVNNITAALCEADPANRDGYLKNAEAYKAKLEELDGYAKKALEKHKGRRFIIYHGPFSYFARDYGLVQSSIADMAGNAPTPAKLKEIYDIVKKDGIKFIVSEPAYSDNEIKNLAGQLDLRIVVMDPVESYDKNARAEDHFILRMRSNIDTLAASF